MGGTGHWLLTWLRLGTGASATACDARRSATFATSAVVKELRHEADTHEAPAAHPSQAIPEHLEAAFGTPASDMHRTLIVRACPSRLRSTIRVGSELVRLRSGD